MVTKSQDRESLALDTGSRQFVAATRASVSPAALKLRSIPEVLKALFSFPSMQGAFSFPAMLGALLVTGVFAARREFVVDPDFWWHLKVGDGILATRHWPMIDQFSFTAAGRPWLAAEWLGEVLLALVARLAGLRGLEALHIILGAAILLALYAFATLRCGNSKAAFVAAGLLLTLATVSFSLRPQMFGYLFLVLTLITLERLRQNRLAGSWILPLIFLIWVNTHPSWLIGLGTMFLYYLSGWKDYRIGAVQMCRWEPAARRRLAHTIFFSVAVLPITPYGIKLATFPFQFMFSLPSNLANIVEWQPLPFDQIGAKLLLILVFALWAAQIFLRLTWRAEEIALFFFGFLMACLHARFLLLFVPFFAPLLATLLARWVPAYDKKKDQYLLNAALMTAMLVTMIWYFPSRAAIERKVASEFPSDAVQYLRAHAVPRPMFNAYGFGGYLVWADVSGHKVFIDGRGELYEPAGVLPDYMDITLLKPGFLALLERYGIESCLLAREQPLATVLAARPDWRKVYSDQTSVIFIRGSDRQLASATAVRNLPPQREQR